MKTLNRFERAMAIEYYATQCAEEMPADDSWDVRDWHIESHWTALLNALGQSWRNPTDAGWDELIENMVSANHLDRDPAGFVNALGDADTEENHDYYRDYYNDLIGAGIDAISSRAH